MIHILEKITLLRSGPSFGNPLLKKEKFAKSDTCFIMHEAIF